MRAKAVVFFFCLSSGKKKRFSALEYSSTFLLLFSSLTPFNLVHHRSIEYSARQIQMAEEMMAVAQSQRGQDFVVSKCFTVASVKAYIHLHAFQIIYWHPM